MEAGVEFPAGDYNLTVVSDYGSVVVKRGDYEVFHSFLEAGQLYRRVQESCSGKRAIRLSLKRTIPEKDSEVHLDAREKIYPGVTSRKGDHNG